MCSRRSRSRYGWAATSDSSSGTSSAWRPSCEVGADPILDRCHMELFEPRALGLDERRLAEVGEHRARPERERFAQGLRGVGWGLAPRAFDATR